MDHCMAVLTDKENRTASAEECVSVQIYRNGSSGWYVEKAISWNIGNTSDMVLIRNRVRELIAQLGECRILICRKMGGVAYHIFEKHGFEIFEAEEIVDGIFDQILADLDEAEEAAKALRSIPKEPVCPNDDGVYYLNLMELQQQFPEISSKKALQHFMENTIFYRFELICNHLPPWTEELMQRKNYGYTTEILDDTAKRYVITRKACYE